MVGQQRNMIALVLRQHLHGFRDVDRVQPARESRSSFCNFLTQECFDFRFNESAEHRFHEFRHDTPLLSVIQDKISLRKGEADKKWVSQKVSKGYK